MKIFITASALALLSNLAVAESFTYEQQIGNPDLDANVPSLDYHVTQHQRSDKQVRVSLDDWYRGNPDVENVPYDHEGIVISSPMTFTAYDELSRQNPDLGGV